MRIDAQEIMLLNNKYGMKKMNEEPTTTNPQEPTTKDGYAIMNAMDLQGRNNINFQAINMANLGKQVKKPLIGAVAALGILAGATSCEKMFLPNEIKQEVNVNVNIDTSIFAAYLQQLLDAKKIDQAKYDEMIKALNQIASDLQGFRADQQTFNMEVLNYMAKDLANSDMLVNLVKTSNVFQESILNATVANGKTLEEAKVILANILNSNLSSEEKLAKIYDMLGTYLPQIREDILALKAEIQKNTQVNINNGFIAHQDAVISQLMLKMISGSVDKLTNYTAVKILNLLKEFKEQDATEHAEIMSYMEKFAMYFEGIREDIKAGTSEIVSKLDTVIMNQNITNEELEETNNKLDKFDGYAETMIKQNNKLVKAVKKLIGQGATLIEIANNLDINVEKLKSIIEDLHIEVTVEAEAKLSDEQLNDILEAINASTTELQNIGDDVAELKQMLAEYAAMVDKKSDEALELLQKIHDKIGDIKCTCDCSCGHNEGWDVDDLFD